MKENGMSKSNEGTGVKRGGVGVSRRKFLERTVATSGAALITATAASCAAGQESKQANAPNQEQTAAKAAALKGEMVEYKSGELMIPAYLSHPQEQKAG